MKRLILALLSLLIAANLFSLEPRKAVVISPVADLLGQPHEKSTKKHHTIEDYYHNIPFSGNGEACQRLHQVLFNELVEVLEETAHEAKVRISNFYYIKHNESGLHDTYWIAKKHLLFLDSKKNHDNKQDLFPPPISYELRKLPQNKEKEIVTLKKPFSDSITKKTYSVGTRFIAVPGQDFSGSHDRGFFTVYIYDLKSDKILQTKIPKKLCIRNYFSAPKDQIHNFVTLLRSWTKHKQGFIPYVLGGFSWTSSCCNDTVETQLDPQTKKPFFNRKDWPHKAKQGFDCVGIIGRAAQICDIPFYYKNTLTLLKGLKPLKKSDKIMEGDLIWYPGHVMIVSNLEKNLIIEARGYDHGKGRVAESPISSIFEGVHSFDQLIEAKGSKQTFSILDRHGKVFMKSKNIHILKILSLWDEK